MLAQVVLQQCERAGAARELHQGAVYHCGDVRPDDPGPSPCEKDATHNEADEQQAAASSSSAWRRTAARRTCQWPDDGGPRGGHGPRPRHEREPPIWSAVSVGWRVASAAPEWLF